MVLLLLFSILLLAAGLAILVKRWPRGWQHSFSQHAAQTRSATAYYAILFVLALVPLNIFMFGWFIPAFQMPIMLGFLLLLSSILQIACTLLPEKGRTVKIHRQLAGASALLLLPSLGLIYAGNSSASARIAITIGVVLMIGTMLWFALDRQKRTPYLLQVVCYLGFFGPLIWIALGGLK